MDSTPTSGEKRAKNKRSRWGECCPIHRTTLAPIMDDSIAANPDRMQKLSLQKGIERRAASPKYTKITACVGEM